MRHWFTETSTVSLASLPLEFGEKKRWKVYGYLYYFHNTSIITSLIKRITHFERLYGLQSLWVRIPLDFFQKPWFCCGYYICHFILLHASDHVWISINRELVWRSTKVIAMIKEKKVQIVWYECVSKTSHGLHCSWVRFYKETKKVCWICSKYENIAVTNSTRS